MEARKTLNISLYAPAVAVFATALAYLMAARSWITLLYVGKASDTLTTCVGWIYPRFFTEKHRFPVDFFIQKADQVMIRLVLVLCIGLYIGFRINNKNAEKIDITSKEKLQNYDLTWLPIYFTTLALLFTWDWYLDLQALYEARAFYAPVFLLRILHLPFPSREASFFCCMLLWISALGVTFGGRARAYFATLFFVLFLVLQGYQMSFYKIDHTFALFTYWAALMPVILYLLDKKQDASWYIVCLQIALCLPYTFAGIEKIAIAGFAWLQPYTLQAYLHMHAQPWGLWLAKSDVLCTILSILMLGFELFFILVVRYHWAKFVFLPAGILFHISTYLLMGAGAWIHPWWLCYGIFLLNQRK